MPFHIASFDPPSSDRMLASTTSNASFRRRSTRAVQAGPRALAPRRRRQIEV
jgi:hypothetical protein